MALPTINIDDVVREVLAQLGLATEGVSSTNGKAEVKDTSVVASQPPQEPPAPQLSKPATADGELAVQSRVVALAELKDRLAGIRKLIVPPQAIVTPAVRDELRRRNIALVVGQKSSVPSNTEGTRLVLMVTHAAMDPAGLVAALKSEGIGVEVQTSDCLIRATDQLAVDLKGNGLGVLATPYAPAGLCLANRLAGVRAVLGLDARTVAADTASVGANLLVVNPAVLGLFQLRQLVSRFYQEPRHTCPKVLSERLG